ncbi:unnamed protein product [Auanema sp. JU1783]|nr:unnamed protein product [Auanema sp. JU1783]
MKLRETVYDLTRRHPLLLSWVFAFNVIPVTIFMIIILFCTILNFGTALLIEMAAMIICLSWLVPCMICCSVSAGLSYWIYMKIFDFYGISPDQFLFDRRRVSALCQHMRRDDYDTNLYIINSNDNQLPVDSLTFHEKTKQL